MKFSTAFVSVAAGVVSASPHLSNTNYMKNPHFRRASPNEWTPAGPDDFRGPCPMMNTLANHGFLPHDGRNLTQDTVVSALNEALNFNQSLGTLMFQMAIVANPEPNATFFTLDHLNRHNVLEHDASLSRTDAFFGSNHIFNQTVFDESRKYWTADVLDANMLANSKVARQVTSKAFNPNYTFTATVENFSLGEVAAPIIVFGDMDAGTVNKTLVEYFFQNERLPVELGWAKKSEVISQEDILKVVEMINKASSLITGSEEAKHQVKIRDLHMGFSVLAQLK
ncbi:putative sterigmatocystin biosynthesis peroxidase stcC [Colletotrichum orbiculare MAFF 240422]|uniref:Sterigmatocystin biosynthesis peroxidase stcC n=1 Tax=Colletotrichum orbiculare (strain 104-T / ATCC 96160 / CBS 514.97 / LARS 414 / MAFF 240422) TaxID=1213857 RepID=N4VC48_COLOR|nr:putative sterigmatocystin biosynthesis peroxidase stcC [Colletotrichum orbiculare MAFF 240422]